MLFAASNLHGQDMQFAKEVINTLGSPELKGRGYVGNGNKLAADYIAREFDSLGVKKFGDDYFQPFTMPVNTFPGKMIVLVNGKKLNPGEDFLIDPGSPGISGKFKTVHLTAGDLLDETAWIKKVKSTEGKFIVVEAYDKNNYNKDQQKRINDVIAFLQYSKDNPARGTVVITNDKLTWSGSMEQFTNPSIIVKSKALPSPVKTVEFQVENKFYEGYETQNVVGYIEGKEKDSLLILTAHYDHLGMMGSETMFPGANDNASGVALLLNLAKYYSSHPPEHTTVFIAFSGEELGLVGSAYFVEHPAFPLGTIKFLINFDISGTGDDGIQVVNGKIYQDKFDRLTAINERLNLLKQVKIRGEACNSDHCMFYKKGVPCFFIYTLGGIQAYHDIYDKPQTLPLTEYEDYFRLITEFLKEI